MSLMASAPVRAEAGHSFASAAACRSSGLFSADDCVAAFDRAEILMRERAPHFPDRIDCVLSFKLCERQDGAYRPSMLGVDVRKAPGGTEAVPILAVEAPRGQFRDPPPAPAPPPRVAAPRSRPATSVYGDLVVDADLLVPSGPQTLAKYRQVIDRQTIEAARLRPSAPRPDPAVWRAAARTER